MTVITNTTPWNTQDLEKLLLPMSLNCNLIEIAVTTLEPSPGVARENQKSARVSWQKVLAYDHVFVQLLTPKRASRVGETLDRLSLVGDLEANEAMLPRSAISLLAHAFTEILRQGKWWDPYDLNRHMRGTCKCDIPGAVDSVIVRGDTAIKTHVGRNKTSVDVLKRRLGDAVETLHNAQSRRARAEREVKYYEEKIIQAQARVEKVEDRIRKMAAKVSMSVPLQQHPE